MLGAWTLGRWTGAIGVALVVALAIARVRAHARAHEHVDLFAELNGLLIRCQRLRVAGADGMERMSEQVVALAVKLRSLQLEQPSASASAAYGRVGAAVTAFSTAIAKLEAKHVIAHGQLPELAHVLAGDDAADTFREQLLAEEDEALELHIERARTGTGGLPGLSERLEVLSRLIERLRATEESLDFHAALLQCHARLSSELGYSETNFSYGSTPFHAWCALHTACPELDHAMRACGSEDECVVFGSSLGWLCFYASLTYDIPSTGYEVVVLLVRLADKLASRFDLSSKVTFHAADMLTADLSRAKVVTLTSQCWDRELCSRCHNKLERELNSGRYARTHGPPREGSRGPLTCTRARVVLNCSSSIRLPPALPLLPLGPSVSSWTTQTRSVIGTGSLCSHACTWRSPGRRRSRWQ
jgi:hypothetical protein